MKFNFLNCNFLSQDDIKKLYYNNIQTVEQFLAHADLEIMSKQTNVQLKTLKQAKKFIMGQYSPFPEFGNVLIEKCLKKIFVIKTGCSQIDAMISGGIYSSEITEITGPTSTGKTQICFNLIANMLDQYENFNCLYIDSNRDFCFKRLIQLIEFRLDKKLKKNDSIKSKNILDLAKQVKVVDCHNIFHLLVILFQIKKVNLNSDLNKKSANSEDELSPNFLIIDNLSSLFNQFKVASSDINFFLNHATNQLNYLANNMNMAIVVITQSNDYKAQYTYNSSSFTSTINFNCLYNSIWKNVPNLMVELKKINISNEIEPCKNVLKFEIVKCKRPFIEDSSKRICCFKIEDSGLTGTD